MYFGIAKDIITPPFNMPLACANNYFGNFGCFKSKRDYLGEKKQFFLELKRNYDIMLLVEWERSCSLI